MSAVAKILLFLADHSDVIDLLVEALEGGANKDSVKAAIRSAMIDASDAAMREELDKS
jgi:hypothetical protein